MTRIVAGQARSLTLAVPDAGTRPTSDRVREALFSALESVDGVRGARVLDLYAGSGALAFEALSRGAASATLVERSPAAAAVCRRNAERVAAALRGPAPSTVVVRAVRSYLASAPQGWDLVFCDPPYDIDEEQLGAELALLQPLLSEDALVIVERGRRSPEPHWPLGLEMMRRKDYGETTLWWARPVLSEDADASTSDTPETPGN